METKKLLHMVTFTLTVIGALNWGLVGLLDFNLVETLLSSVPTLERLVYIAVGVSAAYLATTHMNDCMICAQAGKRT